MQDTILIIDDDIQLSQLLQDCLRSEHIGAELSRDGRDGLQRAMKGDFKLIVLDIMMPELNGFEVLTELRRRSAVPVLMLTARGDEIDKVSGFRLGADDYLTKPFSIHEFVVRVQALIRRYTVFNPAGSSPGSFSRAEAALLFGSLSIDPGRRVASFDGQAVDLTGKEFDVLYFLASSPDKVFTKKQIYCAVWQEDYEFDDGNIMAFISKLRKKLDASRPGLNCIQTVWGVGYRFSGEIGTEVRP